MIIRQGRQIDRVGQGKQAHGLEAGCHLRLLQQGRSQPPPPTFSTNVSPSHRTSQPCRKHTVQQVEAEGGPGRRAGAGLLRVIKGYRAGGAQSNQ